MWNPFKNKQPPPAPEPAPAPVEEHPLLSAIQAARMNTLMGDMRPLHHTIIDSQLLVPLHEPPANSIKFVTTDHDTTLPVFTDIEQLKAFFSQAPIRGAMPLDGKLICKMAQQTGLQRIVINPEHELTYKMYPMVFSFLAQGIVPAMRSDTMPEGEWRTNHDLTGLPLEPLLTRWRATLTAHQAEAAWWVALANAQQEGWYLLVTQGAQDEGALHTALINDWVAERFFIFPFGCVSANAPHYRGAAEAGGIQIFPG